MQMGLFAARASEPLVLVRDSTGEIAYFPAVLDLELAGRIFARLYGDMPWSAERRPMYDRVVDVPRLTARLELDTIAAEPDLRAMSERVGEVTAAQFNSVSLNLYRDQYDSVAWHGDHENELVPNPVIALVSLGATREMRIRTKALPRRTFRLDLEPGSLLVMSGASQHYWEHHVPKERRVVAPRISVAFRQRPEEV
jgi:alkylated DNA repair dioxygenase AlkB